MAITCTDELHLDDVGTSLQFAITECEGDGTSSIVDLTGASVLTVRFKKPDEAETIVNKAAQIYTGGTNGDATDGIIEYITEDLLVDVTGPWKAQAIVQFPNGSKFHSSIVDITVTDNL